METHKRPLIRPQGELRRPKFCKVPLQHIGLGLVVSGPLQCIVWLCEFTWPPVDWPPIGVLVNHIAYWTIFGQTHFTISQVMDWSTQGLVNSPTANV